MIILSWNIQKITAEKAATFAPIIGNVVNGVTGGKPFILVVYENKKSPDAVLNSIGTGIKANNINFNWYKVGGGSSVSENILIIAGNGATFDKPTAFQDWRPDFDERCKLLHQREIQNANQNFARLNALRSTRESTAQGRQMQLDKAVQGTFKPADHFRDPVIISAQADGQRVNFLALHAPGPSAGDEHEEPYAVSFAEAVLSHASRYDLVLGDFNLRTSSIGTSGFVDQSVRLGATTKGKEDGRHTWSRLDRVYTRPGLAINTALVSDSQEKELTDHHCLAISLEKQTPQHKITSYFAYEPSPVRQQQVLYDNYHQAFMSRSQNDDGGLQQMDVED